MMQLLDVSGDGQIQLEDFVDVAARGAGGEPEQSIGEIVDSLFAILDQDGNGDVSIAEFRSTLMALNLGLEPEDLDAAASSASGFTTPDNK